MSRPDEPLAEPLPEDPDAYFLDDHKAVLLPLERLEATRKRPEGVRNADILMRAAARGEGPKRAPIDVEEAGPERWRIVDGNSTFAVAQLSGWKHIPCRVRTAAAPRLPTD